MKIAVDEPFWGAIIWTKLPISVLKWALYIIYYVKICIGNAIVTIEFIAMFKFKKRKTMKVQRKIVKL